MEWTKENGNLVANTKDHRFVITVDRDYWVMIVDGIFENKNYYSIKTAKEAAEDWDY